MVSVRSPLIDLEMDDQTARYVAVLERQLVALTINEAKFRALLEMLTGDTWDDMATDFEQNELDRLAEESLMRKLNISSMEAKRIIRQNKNKANGEPEQESVPKVEREKDPGVGASLDESQKG